VLAAQAWYLLLQARYPLPQASPEAQTSRARLAPWHPPAVCHGLLDGCGIPPGRHSTLERHVHWTV